MRHDAHYTSPGGRVFGAIAALVLLVMVYAAGTTVADAFADGRIAVRIRRGGRIGAVGWRAYLYGVTAAVAGLSFLVTATACAAAAVLPSRLSGRVWPLMIVGAALLAAAGLLALVFAVATILK